MQVRHESATVTLFLCTVCVYVIIYAGAGSDYATDDASGTIQVDACTRKSCFMIGIVDSNQLESDESFDISLYRNGLDSDITIGQQLTTITITDDDSKLYSYIY